MKTKTELLEQMKKVSANIGRIEIQRGMYGMGTDSEYISPKEIRKQKAIFAKLQRQYKKLYFS